MKSVDNDHLMEATEPIVVAGPSLFRWPSLVNGFGHQMERRGCTGNWTWERVPAEENSRLQKGGHARKEYRWPQRSHGTTRRQPLQVFLDEERRILAPWDGDPYEVTDWRTAKVHPDHHVACQYALYSVPSALCPPG